GAEEGEHLASPDRHGHAVDGRRRAEPLGDAVEREDCLGAAGLRPHASVRSLMTALALSWVLTTSGRFSSASTCRSLAPRGTAYMGLPGSTPIRRLFVSTSRAPTICASLVRSQLTKSLAAFGWGARLTSHSVLLLELNVSISGKWKVLRFLPSPWRWNWLRSSGLTPRAMG